VRPRAGGAHPHAQRALAAGLDESPRRFAEDGDIGVEPVRHVALDDAESVVLGGDLLAVVEDQRQVVAGLHQRRGQVQEDGVARLHIHAAATVDDVGSSAGGSALPSVRHVVGDGHGVEMSGQQDTSLPAQVGPGQHAVAVADDLEPVGLLAQRGLDGVGDRRLVAGLAGDVDERRGELRRVGAQVQCHAFHRTGDVGVAPPSTRASAPPRRRRRPR
jgi:hypothetical protein